jgi:GT2 family glycosyltransferase/2-polyprenyl-3-methyl-5-hydroxy-6-metoxy-1,4-benzoquinol methylase
MPNTKTNFHVYERSVLEDDNDSLTLLARHILPGTMVLDLGMGTGGLGKYLTARQSVTLDGLTLSEKEAHGVGFAYRKVVIADLDNVELSQLFDGQLYDYIVLADVIEHLKYPDRILQQCHQLLKSGGQLLTSVPNMGYCGLLAELLVGEFRYRPEGLLDETHLRFFTRKSLHRFFGKNGWHVKNSQITVRNIHNSEFKCQFDLLPPAVTRHLLALPDAATYQFISCLEPATINDALAAAHSSDSPPALPMFSSQLYLAIDEKFGETDKRVVAGTMGDATQILRFEIPALVRGRYTRVRLDPSDRPGFMRISSLCLSLNINSSSEAKQLWAWASDTSNPNILQQMPQQQISWSPPWGPSNAAWLHLYGDDPWIELPVSDDGLEALTQSGGELVMQASWPMSADYIQANQQLQSVLVEQERLSEQGLELQNALEIARQNQSAQDRRLQELAQQKASLAQNLASLHQQRQVDHEQLKSLEQQIGLIKNSKIYRWSRPLANIKYTVDGWRGLHPAVHTLPTQADRVGICDPKTHALPRPNTPVDVIVPVYRGLEDTQRCINSALASACQTTWHLIVINDCSPDPEICQWLRDLANKDSRITLIENIENLGFVATVNKGMRLHSDRDVLLLNSDTEVANDWLDRIQRAAYSRPQVASVTPFSNNATICSYPRFCQVNGLPAGHSTESLDSLFATHLSGHSVEVPTGVGFCMYIRRACLEAIGDFDEANFGKGYGEENDFCIRATKAGWLNLHTLDTFVRHVGGISFGDSKSERELNAMRTMARLHPRYDSDVHKFIGRDPALWARRVIDVARITCSKKPVILNITHNREGGTLRHLKEMGRHMAEHATYLRLSPAPGGVEMRLEGEFDDLLLHFNLPQDQDRLVHTLQDLQVAHVHIHHLLGHGHFVSELPALLGVAYDFSLHDYYSYCPQISLTDETHSYCGEQGIEQCRQCVRRNPAPEGLDIETWRALHKRLLEQARTVISPSADAGQRLLKQVPLASLQVVPHYRLLAKPPAHPRPQPKLLTPKQALKIVVIGGLSQIKGADVVEALAVFAAKNNKLLDIHLIGFSYRQLRTPPHARLTFHGPYDDGDLPKLLNWHQADVAWFPALCPETYSYTLSACLEQGLPVVATNLGAFVERLSERPWSWLCDWRQTPNEWANFFERIRQENFLTGDGPTPPMTPIFPASLGHDFDYRREYLQGLSKPTLLSTEELHQLALSICQAPISDVSSAQSFKSFTLRSLVIFKSSRLLAPLVKTIPLPLQRRIKSFLLS